MVIHGEEEILAPVYKIKGMAEELQMSEFEFVSMTEYVIQVEN